MSNKNKMNDDPTASLVMKWAEQLYLKGAAQRFMKSIDLSAGNDIYEKCAKVCKWYQQVIINRKYLIKQLIEKEFKYSDPVQLIICGSGKTPLALELLEEYEDNIYRVFELDKHCLREKKEIYKAVAPELVKKIRFIKLDIITENVLNILRKPKNEFQEKAKTIILLEGVSYYLAKKELRKIIQCFSGASQKSVFIIEYLLPQHCINIQRRKIVSEIFNTVKQSLMIKDLTCYTHCELRDTFKQFKGTLKGHYSMRYMEQQRLGKNIYFNTNQSWWIEIVCGDC